MWFIPLIPHKWFLLSYFNYSRFSLDDAADKRSQDCLASLESIDDDLDEKKILAVKMSDTTEARNYGVKSFPSIIVFVKKIPELYEGKTCNQCLCVNHLIGDLTDEAAVLGWALTQAGVKIATTKTHQDPLVFPAADAAKAAPPAPKVTPKDVPKAAPKEEKEELPAPKVAADEEPELSETVDTIKNDNNVVVFFCKYSSVRFIFGFWTRIVGWHLSQITTTCIDFRKEITRPCCHIGAKQSGKVIMKLLPMPLIHCNQRPKQEQPGHRGAQ